MTSRSPALRALLVIVPVWLGCGLPAYADQPARSGNPVFDRTVDLINEHFFAPSALPAFNDAASLAVAQMPDLSHADPAMVGDAVKFVLDSLHSSHTGRFTQDQVNYYELSDVFRFAIRRDSRRLYPQGEVSYAGIGIASAVMDGKTFVTDVYDGGPASRAGILAGDEIIAVDGAAFRRDRLVPGQGRAGGSRDRPARGRCRADHHRRAGRADPARRCVRQGDRRQRPAARPERQAHRLHPPVVLHPR